MVSLNSVDIVGCDPGPTPGLVLVTTHDGVVTNAQPIPVPADELSVHYLITQSRYLGVEAFTPRPQMGHNKGNEGAITLRQVEQIQAALIQHNMEYPGSGRIVRWQTPAQIKGLFLNKTRIRPYWGDFGGWTRHQIDALRHALFFGLRFRLINPIT